jgi:hypothetical protein
MDDPANLSSESDPVTTKIEEPDPCPPAGGSGELAMAQICHVPSIPEETAVEDIAAQKLTLPATTDVTSEDAVAEVFVADFQELRKEMNRSDQFESSIRTSTVSESSGSMGDSSADPLQSVIEIDEKDIPMSKEKRFVCTRCGVRVMSKHNLIRHVSSTGTF